MIWPRKVRNRLTNPTTRKARMKLNITIDIVKVGESYIAGTTLGGFKVRGKRAPKAHAAVRNLLWVIQTGDDDDAALGLELAVTGTTFEDALALEAGDDVSDDGTA